MVSLLFPRDELITLNMSIEHVYTRQLRQSKKLNINCHRSMPVDHAVVEARINTRVLRSRQRVISAAVRDYTSGTGCHYSI